MRKTVLLVLGAFLVLALAAIPVLQGVQMRLSAARFAADLAKYSAAAAEAGTLTARIGDDVYRLGTDSLDTLNRRLGWGASERRTLAAEPQGRPTIRLHLGEACTLTLYALDDEGDDTAVVMTAAGRNYRFRLAGYRLYDWVGKDIAALGVAQGA